MALRDLGGLDGVVRERIARKIESLANNPRTPGAVKLTGEDGLWRVRVGDYRVIYEILHDEQVIIIHQVGHRREVYRRP